MTSLKSLLAVGTLALACTTAFAANTPYGSCSDSAQSYQDRYQSTMRASDLVCYQKALERELGGNSSYACDKSADHYQAAYEANQQSSDLVCYQEALERELQ
ncbi:hypothetical protein [Pseudomonas sp. RIT-PI-q]|uniref:hypothetical protein n=1 Tax=Pseudomonas sp. RIT-PI-q TaxID=1690247 RepID=UPI000A8E724B|nr:hypothetical protein [Pseudomonas sp. RIT-PI-q]